MAVSPTFRRDTLGVGVPALLADYMVRRGADRADFLAEAGLRPEDLAQGGRISLGANRRLWSIAVGRTGDAALGLHLALLARPGSFGLIEYLARSADSLLAAGRRAAEFARIAHDCISLAVEDEGAHVSVIRQDNDEPTLPHVVDFVMAYLVIVVRQLVGGDPGLLAVDLARPRPLAVDEYAQFFRASLTFDAVRTQLTFDGNQARMPLPETDRRLHAVLLRQAEDELAALPVADSFLSDVRAALKETLAADAGRAPVVGRRLGMSERTLRRHLAEAGVSHSELLDEVRRSLAFQLERVRRGPQIEVALELGYASAGAYRRAFRRWTGVTPDDWRRQQCESDPEA